MDETLNFLSLCDVSELPKAPMRRQDEDLRTGWAGCAIDAVLCLHPMDPSGFITEAVLDAFPRLRNILNVNGLHMKYVSAFTTESDTYTFAVECESPITKIPASSWFNDVVQLPISGNDVNYACWFLSLRDPKNTKDSLGKDGVPFRLIFTVYSEGIQGYLVIDFVEN